MSKAILISIRPQWCEMIANGKKTVEVRKTIPKLDTPFKVYMYCTQTPINGDIVLARSEEIRTLFPNKQVVGINKGFAAKEDLSIRGKVFGEFVCNFIYKFTEENQEFCGSSFDAMQLTPKELSDYANGKTVYGLHITAPVIYDKPLELDCFNNLKECPNSILV